MPEIFTIGHSCHELPKLMELLAAHRIEAVGDVRSSPYSARLPQFNREYLKEELKNRGINYAFLGKELGARRSERDCYNGKRADYELIAKLPAFLEGIGRLEKGVEDYRIALLCAEKDPLTCHRTILVSRHLKGRGIRVRHILEDGNIEEHEQAEKRLMEEERVPTDDLFLSHQDLLNRAYQRRSERIAYEEEESSAARGQ